jgi:hypothetical protein
VFGLPGPKARAMELRPLDFGGIFDRAIVLYVRNFVAFAGIVTATIVPVAIVQYFVLVGAQPQLDATLDVLQHPERLRTEHVPTLFDSPLMLAIAIASALFGYYMLAFAVGAVAAGVGRLYRGRPVEFRACYEAVLRRWSSIVAVVGIAVLVLIAAYVGAILIVAVPLFAVASVANSWFGSLVAVAVTGMVVTITFALLLVGVTSACAIDGTVVENCSAAASLQLTFARIFNRSEFGRALLCGFAVGAIATVSFAFVDTVAFLGLSRWPAAYVALDAFARIFVIPFLALVLATYYFDVRVRREGFDMETALQRGPEEPVYAPTAYLSGEERALIKRFLERRDSLTPQRRREIAAQLAAPARQRVPAELQRLEDEPLLERL